MIIARGMKIMRQNIKILSQYCCCIIVITEYGIIFLTDDWFATTKPISI